MAPLSGDHTALGAVRQGWRPGLEAQSRPLLVLATVSLSRTGGLGGRQWQGPLLRAGVGMGMGMGPGSSHQALPRGGSGAPGGSAGSRFPLGSLSAPPACYISALVLSCSLTFLMLIRSLVTHRSVAGSDPRVQMWGRAAGGLWGQPWDWKKGKLP